MDDHEGDGMETERTNHGRWMGIVLLECEAMKQMDRRRKKHEREDGGWNVHDGLDGCGWKQCGMARSAPLLSFRFVSFRFVGGSWWFPKMRRSKPSIDARGRHWIAPCEAKDDACSHAFPTKNERIDGKKPRRKEIHETRYTHPSSIDHETRHDVIVHRPTPRFFFLLLLEDDDVDPSRAFRMVWIRSFPLRPTRVRVRGSRRVRTATHAFLLLSFRSFVRRIRRALVSVRSEERSSDSENSETKTSSLFGSKER